MASLLILSLAHSSCEVHSTHAHAPTHPHIHARTHAQVMKTMEHNIRANDYRSILNFFKVISEVRIIEGELRDYVIKVRD
jgi:hypothetical protein